MFSSRTRHAQARRSPRGAHAARRGSRFRGLRRFLAVLLVLPAIALQAATTGTAEAAVVAGFEIDGNTPDGPEAGADWSSTGTSVSDPVGNLDTTTFKSSKEFEHPSTWVRGTGLAPDQDDVSAVYTHSQVVDGDTWAYLGFRRLTTSGTTNFDVELNQLENSTTSTFAPVRSVGDLMVRFEQDGNSSFGLTRAYRWTRVGAAGWGAACIEVPGYTPGAGWCSISVASSGFVGMTGEDGHFAEGAFNLSSFFGTTDCRGAFGTLNLRSFTGNSNESALKDYIEPIAIDIPSNCGRLRIVKVDQFGNDVGGATFTVSPNPVPGGVGTLTVVDGGAGDPDATADGTITIDPATPGTYTVVETVAPPGYELPPLAERTFTVVVGENGVGSSGPAQVVDRRYFAAPTLVNEPGYDVDHNWRVTKSVAAPASVDVPEGTQAGFEYDVRLEALDATTSDFGGTVTLTNPNLLDMVATLSAGITGGAGCTVVGAADLDVSDAPGLQVNLDPGPTVLAYTCPVAALPGGTTATLTWASATYPSSDAAETYTRSDASPFAVDQRTDGSTTVTDVFAEDAATTRTWGPFSWDEVRASDDPTTHTVVVATYERQVTGVPGRCTSYDNLVSESADGTTDTETVTVCVGRDLDVTKDARLAYERELLWDIAKTGPGTVFTGEDADGRLQRMVRYSIDITADGSTDSAWALTGTIEIDNPNAWAVTGTISDTVVVDGRTLTCDVLSPDVAPAAGHQVTVPADAVDHPFAYECTGVAQGDYVGDNTVTFDYGADSHEYPDADDTDSHTEGVTVTGDTTPTNATVTITDLLDGKDVTASLEQTSFDWSTVHAMEGHTQRVHHDVVLGTTEDACTPHVDEVTIDQTGQSDDHTVTVCSPGLTKSVVASYGRKQPWSLTKDVDKTFVEVGPDGQATFGYTVTATPGQVVPDGTSSWTGVVRVHNPATTDALTVSLADTPSVPGWTGCTFVGSASDLVLGAGEAVLVPYTCSGTGFASGTNTATAAFGDQTVTETVDVEFAPRPGVTDSQTTLSDDIQGDGLPAQQFDVDAAGGADVFTYTRALGAAAGACEAYTNTAVLALTGDDLEAARTVTVCSEAEPTVRVSASGRYGVTYDWSITKEVDRTRVEVDRATGSASFDYTVTVRAGERTAAGYTMGGTLTVSNPNTYEGGAITLTGGTITSDLGGGATCTPDAAIAGTVVPVGQSVDIAFTCTFTGTPATTGTVGASVSWDPAGPASVDEVTGSGAATLTVGGETDRTVDVIDDKTDPANPVVLEEDLQWSEGLVKEYSYALLHRGTPGACTGHTNTALVDLEQRPDPSGTTTATVCVEAPLTASATAAADLARAYSWSVEKVVDATERTVDAAGNATFRYTVTARAGAATDSGWQLSGTITATNPNTYDGGAVTLTGASVATDLGGGSACAAELSGSPVVPTGSREAPGTLTLPFSCTFTSAPSDSGTVTATVTWDPPGEVATDSAVVTRAVALAVRSETDEVVDVVDDKTVPGQRVVLAEDLAWEAGLVRTYTYDLTLRGGAAGACQTYTNTATVDLTAGGDPSAGVTVRACTPAPAPPEVLPGQAFGKAVGAVTSTCQGTVRARLGNRTGERVVYTLRVGAKTHRIAVKSGARKKFVTSGKARSRVVLRVQGRVLDRLRIQDRCAPPEVLPETGLRTTSL